MKKINFRHIKKTADGFFLTLSREYRAVFGFGEKFDSVNQKGKFVRACVREKCFYQGEYTYFSMPFFLTPDGFGIYVDTYVEVDFDFRKEGELTISFPAGSRGEEANIWYFEGTPKEILTQFRTLVGLPRLFPKWVLGAWMSANRWRTQEEVEEQRVLSKKWNFPHNVLVIEPWSDLTTHYLFNECSIPAKEGNESRGPTPAASWTICMRTASASSCGRSPSTRRARTWRRAATWSRPSATTPTSRRTRSACSMRTAPLTRSRTHG